MNRTLAAITAAILALGTIDPAVLAPARAAGPSVGIPSVNPPRQSFAWAYASLATGTALIGGSFAFASGANRTYREYLAASDPAVIERLYDRTVRYDRLSSGSLLTGEVLVAAGLYLRFLRRPPDTRWGLELDPQRCALALRF